MFGVIGSLHCAAIQVTTSGAPNAALSSKPKNPFKHEKCIPICVQGEGVYIEDNNGGAAGFIDGISATDVVVRASTASAEAFIIIADVSNRELFPIVD